MPLYFRLPLMLMPRAADAAYFSLMPLLMLLSLIFSSRRFVLIFIRR